MPTHTTRSDIRLAVHIAALCSLGAAVVHTAVTLPHWEAWWASGLFFAGLAAFQGLWGLLALLRPGARWLIAAAIPVNLGAVGLWAVTRFWAVPAGPAAGTTEEFGAAGLGATLLGILTALGAAWAVIPRVEHATIARGWHAAALGSAAVVVALVAAPAAVAGPSHSHGSGSHEDDTHEAPAEDGHHDEPAPEEPGPDEAGPTESPSPTTTDEPTVPESTPTTDGHQDDGHAH